MPSFGDINSFFRLVRWKNLLIVILTMTLMRYAIIAPLVGTVRITLIHGLGEDVFLKLQLPLLNFIILVLSTVCITAAGYVINDYFDIKTDIINKGKIIVGKAISRQKAMALHSILNFIGVVGGFYVSSRAGYFWFGIIFLLVSGLLYFYSASYKRQFLVGNILVALLVAMVPILVVLFEWSAIYTYCSAHAVTTPDFSFLFYWVGGFAFFAFITNLTREIIKDIEDYEGDVAFGRNTVPIVLGINGAKALSATFIFCTVVLLYLTWILYVTDWITFAYITITVVLPLLLVALLLFRSKKKKQLHFTSSLMKVVMLMGLLYSVVVKIILTWNLL